MSLSVTHPSPPHLSGRSLGQTDRTKYLLLDSRIIQSVEGVQLQLGTVKKDVCNPLFGEDKPWEVRFDNLYPNVIYDSDARLYKCWYSPFIVSPPEQNTPRDRRQSVGYVESGLYPREMAVCYATSEDGIRWIKPDLGLVDFQGSTKNNLVYRLRQGTDEDGVHGAGVFKDTHDSDATRRYKMFFSNSSESMASSVSPDGIHWSPPTIFKNTHAFGDTHNNVFWDARSEQYIGFSRLWQTNNGSPQVRMVGHTQSPDFIHWNKAQIVFEGINPKKQIYSIPVFQYEGLYLGLVSILDENTDRVHCELTWSSDTYNWHRVCPGDAFIPLGPQGSYDYGCVYAAASPVICADEIRLYYAGSNGLHTTWRDGFFCLARLRKDGFAGYESFPGQSGRIVTKSVFFLSELLCLTADVCKGGGIVITVLDDEGQEVARSKPIVHSGTDTPVLWERDPPLEGIRGRNMRLQFDLTEAKLYAFGFLQ